MSRPRPGTVSWGRPDSGSASGERQAKAPRGGRDFLGKYRIVSELGRGGMASVHLARIDGPGGFHRWVAIKRIHPHLVDNDHVVDMFLDEARMAAGINHANVAQVFDLGKDEDSYWIAMEYLHGEPLREIMRQLEDARTPLSPQLAARIAIDALEGLHAAHEVRGKSGQLLGLVHRDVTPHNLIVTYDGCTKVVDFGIALAAERLAKTLQQGQLKGKLAYMSPEQIRNEQLDRTTDLFALGIVLWELTTGQRLFRRDTDLDTLERAQACEVPMPSQFVAGYPAELEQIVLRALARNKADRFPTAREMSRALQSFLMHSGDYVGPDEVAAFVRSLFSDRIEKRNAHLAWAAEVTSTHDLARGGALDESTDDTLTPSQETTDSIDTQAPTRALAPGGPRSEPGPAGPPPPSGAYRTAGRFDERLDRGGGRPRPRAEPLTVERNGPDGELDEEEVQTVALRLSGDQVAAIREGRILPSHILAVQHAREPEARPSDPGPPTPASSGVFEAGGATSTAVTRAPGESTGALIALFVATVVSVLGLAVLLRWIASLF